MTILTPKGYSPARQASTGQPEDQSPLAGTSTPAPEGSEIETPAPRQVQLRFPPQVVGINCPNCTTPYPLQLFSIVDAGQDPILKSLLLAGQLNMAVCPNCGAGGALTAPLLYHDPEHEFLGVYVPEQLPVNEQQKVIGDLSRRLMDGLPQEARRGYMLTPKQFLTYQGLLEAVLEYEGITKEMMEAQRRRLQLVEQALAALQDAEGLRLLVAEHDAAMDDQFFGILQAVTESAASSGDEQSARQLLELRERLIELTTWGKGVQKQRAAIAQLKPDTTPQQLAEMVAAADDMRVVDALIVVGHPLVDYSFYQVLADRIDEADRNGDKAEKLRLSELRDHVLQLSQQINQARRSVVEQASQLLNDILSAPDVAQAVEERAPLIDETFLSVVAANLQQADQRGATAAVQRLKAVWDATMNLLQRDAPPEVRLINQLLSAEYPAETRKILGQQRELITEELIEIMLSLAEEMEQDGNPDVAARLRQIRSQARLML